MKTPINSVSNLKKTNKKFCKEFLIDPLTVRSFDLPFRSKKAGRFDKLLGFTRSHSIVTRGSASLSCATTPHLSCFSKS